ncbi:MAG TPA: hypothetical protein VD884_20125 [Ohtaekwangia sp.]|nr:hypothetical protein [Ohtaekwangia sp.]
MKTALRYIVAVIMGGHLTCNAQLLSSGKGHTLDLDTDFKVMLLRAAENHTHYYYIPLNFQLAEKNGVPEISLLLYRDKNNSLSGGLLHVLITWGLTQKQELKLNQLLSEIDSTGIFMGPAEIVFHPGTEVKISGNELSGLLVSSATSPIKLSPTGLHKTAASFRFSGNDTQTVWDVINKKSSLPANTRFEFQYQYSVVEQKGYMQKAKRLQQTMKSSFVSWIKALKDFNLIKFTNL